MAELNSENVNSCKCGVPERAVADSHIPIVFDKTTNEYQLTYAVEEANGSGSMTFYYCPFCGGRLPKSIRGTLFATVTASETSRLSNLTRHINSIKEAIKAFGEPDFDSPCGRGVGSAPSETKPTKFEVFRTITYCNLSDTCDVEFIDYGPYGIGKNFTGKYIGDDK